MQRRHWEAMGSNSVQVANCLRVNLQLPLRRSNLYVSVAIISCSQVVSRKKSMIPKFSYSMLQCVERLNCWHIYLFTKQGFLRSTSHFFFFFTIPKPYSMAVRKTCRLRGEHTEERIFIFLKKMYSLPLPRFEKMLVGKAVTNLSLLEN